MFILDPRQVQAHPYRSDRALHFMLRSLEHLDVQLQALGSKLLLTSGLAHECLSTVCEKYQARSIYLNRDYTPFSQQRDELIRTSCGLKGIVLKTFDDALLNPPELCLKQDDTPYTVFTPFYKNASRFPVMPASSSPHTTRLIPANDLGHEEDLIRSLKDRFALPDLAIEPEDLHRVIHNLEDQEDYEHSRNDLAADKTSHLSAFLKFGLISVRAVYHRILELQGAGHPLIRQLYWRDFYSHIAYHFPQVFGSAFKVQYEGISWKNDQTQFEAWCQGRTGFPVVDAGMRELNTTGLMHNRARMISASFLVKDLHIDWRWGERYFASRLMDYDPALNNGNWQWAASTGCDAQPYFRIFNPWRQQRKFDPECSYIKKWVPELRGAGASEIHRHESHPLGSYILPLVDHALQAAGAKRLFQEAGHVHGRQQA